MDNSQLLIGIYLFEAFGYGFRFPDTGHWQSGTIDKLLNCVSENVLTH
jgi:hypothetical protein